MGSRRWHEGKNRDQENNLTSENSDLVNRHSKQPIIWFFDNRCQSTHLHTAARWMPRHAVFGVVVTKKKYRSIRSIVCLAGNFYLLIIIRWIFIYLLFAASLSYFAGFGPISMVEHARGRCEFRSHSYTESTTWFSASHKLDKCISYASVFQECCGGQTANTQAALQTSHT